MMFQQFGNVIGVKVFVNEETDESKNYGLVRIEKQNMHRQP